MEETQKLIDEINNLTCMLNGQFSDYEAHDIAVKILALQEQKKANDKISDPITRRDYFAGLALQGILANPEENLYYHETVHPARKISDMLIEELNKQKQQL